MLLPCCGFEKPGLRGVAQGSKRTAGPLGRTNRPGAAPSEQGGRTARRVADFGAILSKCDWALCLMIGWGEKWQLV